MKRMKKPECWIIDSIHEGIARIESPQQALFEIPLHWLPDNVAEGDVIHLSQKASSDERAIIFSVQSDQSRERKDRIEDKLAAIRKREKDSL